MAGSLDQPYPYEPGWRPARYAPRGRGWPIPRSAGIQTTASCSAGRPPAIPRPRCRSRPIGPGTENIWLASSRTPISSTLWLTRYRLTGISSKQAASLTKCLCISGRHVGRSRGQVRAHAFMGLAGGKCNRACKTRTMCRQRSDILTAVGYALQRLERRLLASTSK